MSGEERMVIVQLRCVIFHYLLRMLHCVLAVKLGPCLVFLFLWVLIDEEVFNLAGTGRSVVDNKARSKLSVCTYLYRIQH